LNNSFTNLPENIHISDKTNTTNSRPIFCCKIQPTVSLSPFLSFFVSFRPRRTSGKPLCSLTKTSPATSRPERSGRWRRRWACRSRWKSWRISWRWRTRTATADWTTTNSWRPWLNFDSIFFSCCKLALHTKQKTDWTWQLVIECK